MSEIKLRLNITLQGSVMFSKEECLKTTQKVVNKKSRHGGFRKTTTDVLVEDLDKMDPNHVTVTDENGTNPETIHFYTRKCIPARQSLNICKEAYLSMIGRECPAWVKSDKWAMMSGKERLESHLQRIVKHLGGISYTYQVYED